MVGDDPNPLRANARPLTQQFTLISKLPLLCYTYERAFKRFLGEAQVGAELVQTPQQSGMFIHGVFVHRFGEVLMISNEPWFA